MRDLFPSDLQGPFTPQGGITLGAAGWRNARCPYGAGLCCQFPDTLSGTGSCPCGSVSRLL